MSRIVMMIDIECEKCGMDSHYEILEAKEKEPCAWCGHENETGVRDAE